MDEEDEARREYPLWHRAAMVALMLGAVAQGGWAGVAFGALAAGPLAPGVPEAFSCTT